MDAFDISRSVFFGNRVLVAVAACRTDSYSDCPRWLKDHSPEMLVHRATPEDRLAAVRATFWNHLPFDHKFFFGRGEQTPLPDEVVLNTPDTFNAHCLKNREMLRWALDHNYDWVFRSDDDTFIRPEKLAEVSLSLRGDQIGNGPWVGTGNNYIPGVCWLNTKAMELIVASEPTRTHEDDLWIGEVLKDRALRIHDPRYVSGSNSHFADIEKLSSTDWITAHSCTPQMIHELWNRYGTLKKVA